MKLTTFNKLCFINLINFKNSDKFLKNQNKL